MTPIRPVSEDHRHEPADYELEPNELAACPNPWCESHKRPERGYVPFISKSRASSELRAACPVCPMSGPWADTEAEARKAWNQRTALTQAPRSCWQPAESAPTGAVDMLLLFPNGRQAVGWRHSADYFLDSNAEPFKQEPTHWQPLPEPPATAIRSNSHDG